MAKTILVDGNGTRLAYIDSGPPSGTVYTTIFAVHGVEFTNPIFQKVSVLCRANHVRFVAINRREYKGSTPFTETEKAIITNGTDTQKMNWLKDRGLEIANFVDAFIQRENLSLVSADGKRGGVALLGWSSGATFTAAAISNIDALPSDVRARLVSRLRVHIMQGSLLTHLFPSMLFCILIAPLAEPPSIAFGLPFPPQTFSPQIDTSIPAKARIPAFTLWITSYFQHGDLSTRDTNVLEYVLPATFRMPSIWNMSSVEIADIIDEGPNSTVETPFALNFMTQALAVYNKATFDKSTRALLPHLKVWEISGDATASFSLAALWSMQDDDKAHGGNNINYKIVPGANHFMHWDEPDKTVEAYLEALL
ncbi:hypothetical protein EW146_g1768 [Bondarzewia mesenterica]|uniref:AB hydrolase-1 domain-containing protein n=1 Tax=Bondarzewia mesenterica TaxID=1095465 RepID=A0A4S4M558_9AGAM|nr:hypothetical protein EW146_g1768 [Bondarzewia mesenterica]